MNRKTVGLLSKLALVLAAILWGGSFVVIKGALDGMPAMRLNALRSSISAILLACLAGKAIFTSSRRMILGGALAGVFMWLGGALQTYGLYDTTPGKSAFLTASYCVFTPFFMWLFLKRKPAPRHFIAAFMALIAVGLIALDAKLTMGWGDALSLLCGVAFAGHILSVDTFGKEDNVFVFVMMQFLATAVLSWLAVPISGEAPVAWTWEILWKILYLAIFSSFGGMLLQNVAQKNVEPNTASLLCSLESVFAVLFSILFYHENVTLSVGLGFAVMFFAIVVSETGLSFLKRSKKDLS